MTLKKKTVQMTAKPQLQIKLEIVWENALHRYTEL